VEGVVSHLLQLDRPVSWLAHWTMTATCCWASTLFGAMSVDDAQATVRCRSSSAIVALAEQPMSAQSMWFIDPIMASMDAPMPCSWPIMGRTCAS
jgi:hypothetical protein